MTIATTMDLVFNEELRPSTGYSPTYQKGLEISPDNGFDREESIWFQITRIRLHSPDGVHSELFGMGPVRFELTIASAPGSP